MSSAPHRILFLRPDAYGDLVLFEPVLRLVREKWPATELCVLVRERYADIIPLLDPAGAVRWLTTGCDPYREGPGGARADLAALRSEVGALAPDCLVAACASQTWLEAAVATFLPGARQVSLGPGLIEPLARAALAAELPVDWSTIYPEKVAVEPGLLEWEQNLRLAGALLGEEAPRWWPVAQVPAEAKAQAARIAAEMGLSPGAFAACAAAGSATVAIKSWPPERYGEALGWLERERGIRALLVGHRAERETLEAVREAARSNGANPALWAGRHGEIAVLAGLLEAAQFYVGNDTGALHLAAALGRPILGVYGGGTWPRFKPVARRAVTVVQPLACFGCDWNCHFGYAPCVREIPAGAVTRALDWLLASDESARQEITVTDEIPAQGQSLIAGAAAAAARGRSAARETVSPSALTELFKQLDYSETDRAARLAVIEAQGDEAGRLRERLGQVDGERRLLAAQLEDLRGHLERSEADRRQRLGVIEEQGSEISRLHAEVARWLGEAGELWPRLNAAEHERHLLAAQLADLRGRFQHNEADREARLAVIQAQGAEVSRLHAETARWIQEAADLWPRLNAAENARNLLAAQHEDLRGQLERSEADRAARLAVIEQRGMECERLRSELARALKERDAAESKRKEAVDEGRALERTIADLHRTIAGLQSANADLHGANVDLQGGIADLHGRIGELERRKRQIDQLWSTWVLKRLRRWPH